MNHHANRQKPQSNTNSTKTYNYTVSDHQDSTTPRQDIKTHQIKSKHAPTPIILPFLTKKNKNLSSRLEWRPVHPEPHSTRLQKNTHPSLNQPTITSPRRAAKSGWGRWRGPGRSWSKPAGHAAYEHIWQIYYQIQNWGWKMRIAWKRQKRAKTCKSGWRWACVVLPSSGSPCSSARRCVLNWGASVKNRWGSWLRKSAFCRSAFSFPTASFAVPEWKKKSLYFGSVPLTGCHMVGQKLQ